MGHYQITDLQNQQEHLSATQYDIRITNLARFILRKIKKQGTFIDIGAGNGLVLRFFRDRGFKVAGMELSQELVDAMKKNPTMRGIELSQGNIVEENGKENFDYVLASDVIEHIEDDRKALKNLFSFVKPGGLLILTVPAHSHLFGKRDKAWGHHRRYDKKDLLDKLKVLDGTVEFATQWNLLGHFPYFFSEKILQKPINETLRHSQSLVSRMVRKIIELELRIEELFGFSPIGLTLVVGFRKAVRT
ncbi:hypothetical protein A3G67_03020 [Candidatus Roizmanbacteria bacterium RIFCSPLOWO2_12_FULL_40_12]|nr:MAG: hypothetical protein A3G67_03020 [Candidatus Roizmanbacteria bacterium RIFCSPLOWO2_12_FULL_40_12]